MLRKTFTFRQATAGSNLLKRMTANDVSGVPQAPNGNPTGGQSAFPAYGNVYAGRVNTGDYTPPRSSGVASGATTEKLIRNGTANDANDPILKAKLDRCPYFALCDMCVWQGMDPQFLDPGFLSDEEHLFLLLHSRAYFEKWKQIHAAPRNYGPHIRIKKGRFEFLKQLLDTFLIDEAVQVKLREMLVDDATLIAMHPRLWLNANFDAPVREQLTGRCLELAGLNEYQRNRIYDCLNVMRRIRVVRRDHIPPKEQSHYRSHLFPVKEEVPEPDELEPILYPYAAVRTLYDLSTKLGVQPYNGQIKLYNFIDEKRTKLVLTVDDEDTYFDFLMTNFYKSNLSLYGQDCMARYTIVVEPPVDPERNAPRWF